MATLYDTLGVNTPAYGTQARTDLATKAGIGTGYTGSADQNAKIVDYLNSQKNNPPQVTNTNTNTNTGGTTVDPATKAMNDALAAKAAADAMNTDPNANDRSNALQMFQGEIDALNQVYADQKQKESIAGQSRLGSTAAMNAAGGMAGSSFGKANADNQIAANTELQNAIDNKHNIDIQAALGKASAAAVQMAKDRVAAAQKGADSLITTLKAQQDNAKNAISGVVKSYLANGGDPNKFDDSHAQAIVDSFAAQGIHLSKDDIINTMKDTIAANNKTKVENDKAALDNKLVQANITNKNADTQKLLNEAATSKDWGAISNNDKTDIVNYLNTHPGVTSADITRAQTDRGFQAFILSEVQKEKAAVSNPFATQ
jgi:hypothetical protein